MRAEIDECSALPEREAATYAVYLIEFLAAVWAQRDEIGAIY
ncbi:MAG: hypothetical protein OES13_09585 [Acidimicrobiia bacterium]|nr:hypothetical protein [Acidimicrobiia bacterium]